MTDNWFYSTPQWQAYLDAFDPPQPWHTNNGAFGNLIVHLQVSNMWAPVRKGHQAAIRKAQKTTSIIVDTDGDHLDVFQGLHLLDAGRVTRPQKTWDIMRDWLPQGFAVLFIAVRDHLPIGGAYFLRYLDSAYYGSAARDPNLSPKESPAHLLVWSAMTWLHDHGYRYLDLGPVPAPDATAKELSIHHFKTGFGAEIVQKASALELVNGVADHLARVAEKELA